MKYNHISIEGASSDNQKPIDKIISDAITKMQSESFEFSRETLKSLLVSVREKSWAGKVPQPVLETIDGRDIPVPPTRLLAQVLIQHPDLIPFILDHYLITSEEPTAAAMVIVEEDRDRTEKIKAAKMERLLADLGYSPTKLTEREKQIAFSHQYDSFKSELLESLFVYSKQAITFYQSEKTRKNLGNLLSE